MRLVYISTLYRGGGAERCARGVMDQAIAAGHQTRMLTARLLGNEPSSVQAVRIPGEKYLRAMEKVGLGGDWRFVGSRRMLPRITPANTDVVHLHNLHGGWMSIRAARDLCRRMPSVWTLHDEWAPNGGLPYDLTRDATTDQVQRWLGTLDGYSGTTLAAQRQRVRILDLLPKPDFVATPSSYLAEMVARCPQLERVPVKRIPYGLGMLHFAETAFDRAACRARFGVPLDRPVVLLVAANFASPYKGMHLAAEALQRLKHTRTICLLVGSGAGELARQIGIESIHTGHLADDALLAQAYRAADLTLVPSIADNFPYVALESLACGTPLVTFAIGGLVEICGEDQRGLRAKPFDSMALGQCISALLENHERRTAMGVAGRAWALEHCDPQREWACYCDLYEQAIAARQSRAHLSGAKI